MNNCPRQGLLPFSFWSPFLTDAILYLIFVGYHFQSHGKFCFLLGQFTSFSKLTKINCPTICLYKLSKWLTDSRIAHEYFRQEIEKKRESKLEWVREDLDMSINKYKSRIKNRFLLFIFQFSFSYNEVFIIRYDVSSKYFFD